MKIATENIINGVYQKKVANSIAIEISKILGHSFKENPKTENN